MARPSSLALLNPEPPAIWSAANGPNWLIGQLRSTTVNKWSTAAETDQVTLVRHAGYAYAAGTGLMTVSVVEPTSFDSRGLPIGCVANTNDPICAETDYRYDAYGNRLRRCRNHRRICAWGRLHA